MISDDWFSDFLKSNRNWDLLPIDIYYGALFTGWVWHGFGIHRSLLLFLSLILLLIIIRMIELIMIWLFIYKRYWSVDFVKGRVYYYYSIYLSIFYLISSEFACFEDDMWNAWFTSILLPYSSIFTIVLFYIWLLGFKLRNTEISHTDLFKHEYLQAEITFRYYLNIVSN